MKSDKKPDVCVVGLGYIGLPTAAIVARSGCRVRGIDVSQKVVDTINRGEIHIEEVDLDGLVHAVVGRGPPPRGGAGRCVCHRRADALGPNHEPDVSYVLTAARSIAPVLKQGDIVILESTSPVGTTEQIRDLFAEARPI
jgi:UDP-N-acetyl-D-mannosaminuronic acid dehydrogenase